MKWQALIASIGAVVFIIMVGCSITTRSDMENWNFSSSVYFWFISLTTIGYGDLHFDRNKHLASIHLLLISASLLLFGLGMVAAVVESFAMAMEKQAIDEDGDEESGSLIDFSNHERVLNLVLSTITCGAGVVMESQATDGEDQATGTDKVEIGNKDTTEEKDYNEQQPSRPRRKRGVTFMDQTIELHQLKTLQSHNEEKEEESTELDEITAR